MLNTRHDLVLQPSSSFRAPPPPPLPRPEHFHRSRAQLLRVRVFVDEHEKYVLGTRERETETVADLIRRLKDAVPHLRARKNVRLTLGDGFEVLNGESTAIFAQDEVCYVAFDEEEGLVKRRPKRRGREVEETTSEEEEETEGEIEIEEEEEEEEEEETEEEIEREDKGVKIDRDGRLRRWSSTAKKSAMNARRGIHEKQIDRSETRQCEAITANGSRCLKTTSIGTLCMMHNKIWLGNPSRKKKREETAAVASEEPKQARRRKLPLYQALPMDSKKPRKSSTENQEAEGKQALTAARRLFRARDIESFAEGKGNVTPEEEKAEERAIESFKKYIEDLGGNPIGWQAYVQMRASGQKDILFVSPDLQSCYRSRREVARVLGLLKKPLPKLKKAQIESPSSSEEKEDDEKDEEGVMTELNDEEEEERDNKVKHDSEGEDEDEEDDGLARLKRELDKRSAEEARPHSSEQQQQQQQQQQQRKPSTNPSFLKRNLSKSVETEYRHLKFPPRNKLFSFFAESKSAADETTNEKSKHPIEESNEDEKGRRSREQHSDAHGEFRISQIVR
jgi:hypothetical protein